MLVDWHKFQFHATVPWPMPATTQVDWVQGLYSVEEWLKQCIGPRYSVWAYDDCEIMYNIGVAFRWDEHRTLFMLTWSK